MDTQQTGFHLLRRNPKDQENNWKKLTSCHFSILENEICQKIMIAFLLQDGVYIKGLYLQGAGWDQKNSCLIEAEPMQLVCPIPTIHFRPVENKKKTMKGNPFKCQLGKYLQSMFKTFHHFKCNYGLQLEFLSIAFVSIFYNQSVYRKHIEILASIMICSSGIRRQR